ncbi:MAG TPA: hypothetical protein VJX70_01960, partial [Candidatus Acidoferrum sp.]|nr:hypothetical protein [Candidatus Acidoferrum sp.]
RRLTLASLDPPSARRIFTGESFMAERIPQQRKLHWPGDSGQVNHRVNIQEGEKLKKGTLLSESVTGVSRTFRES